MTEQVREISNSDILSRESKGIIDRLLGKEHEADDSQINTPDSSANGRPRPLEMGDAKRHDLFSE